MSGSRCLKSSRMYVADRPEQAEQEFARLLTFIRRDCPKPDIGQGNAVSLLGEQLRRHRSHSGLIGQCELSASSGNSMVRIRRRKAAVGGGQFSRLWSHLFLAGQCGLSHGMFPSSHQFVCPLPCHCWVERTFDLPVRRKLIQSLVNAAG